MSTISFTKVSIIVILLVVHIIIVYAKPVSCKNPDIILTADTIKIIALAFLFRQIILGGVYTGYGDIFVGSDVRNYLILAQPYWMFVLYAVWFVVAIFCEKNCILCAILFFISVPGTICIYVLTCHVTLFLQINELGGIFYIFKMAAPYLDTVVPLWYAINIVVALICLFLCTENKCIKQIALELAQFVLSIVISITAVIMTGGIFIYDFKGAFWNEVIGEQLECYNIWKISEQIPSISPYFDYRNIRPKVYTGISAVDHLIGATFGVVILGVLIYTQYNG